MDYDFDQDPDIRIAQSFDTDVNRKFRAIKRLSNNRRYKLSRCPSCRNIVVRDIPSGNEIMIDDTELLCELFNLDFPFE
jgi:hypothetical protein